MLFGVRTTCDLPRGMVSLQSEVYERVGRKAVEDVMNGFNATIFAYGQVAVHAICIAGRNRLPTVLAGRFDSCS